MGYLKTVGTLLKRTRTADEKTDLYAHEIGLLEGGSLDLAEHRGQPTLFVNTASKCGFTPQFTGLQELQDAYGERGLRIVGCPSGDFAEQEHDDAAAIGEVCQRNYGVSFAMTEKVSVRADPHPLWADLNRQPGSKAPVWNFTKYLVGADGRLVARWSPKTEPTSAEVRSAIEGELAKA